MMPTTRNLGHDGMSTGSYLTYALSGLTTNFLDSVLRKNIISNILSNRCFTLVLGLKIKRI